MFIIMFIPIIILNRTSTRTRTSHYAKATLHLFASLRCLQSAELSHRTYAHSVICTSVHTSVTRCMLRFACDAPRAMRDMAHTAHARDVLAWTARYAARITRRAPLGNHQEGVALDAEVPPPILDLLRRQGVVLPELGEVASTRRLRCH